jgi:hypothetical protein
MAEVMKQMQREEDNQDTMRQLENKVADSKREMTIMDALEEIKEFNARVKTMDSDELVARTRAEHMREDLEAERRDEEEMQRLFGGAQHARVERRIEDEAADAGAGATGKEESEAAKPAAMVDPLAAATATVKADSSLFAVPSFPRLGESAASKPESAPALPSVAVVVKRKADGEKEKKKKKKKRKAAAAPAAPASGLIAAYSSSSSGGSPK